MANSINVLSVLSYIIATNLAFVFIGQFFSAVAFNINKLTVKVNMVDSNTQFESIYSFNTTNATYNTGNTFDWNLDEGENTLTIQGISEYGTKSADVYTVKVTKNAASTDNELIDLIVSSSNTLTPNFITGFNKDNLTYSIEIPRGFSSLYIKATPSSNKATIKIGIFNFLVSTKFFVFILIIFRS